MSGGRSTTRHQALYNSPWWRQESAAFRRRHPRCIDCGAPTQVVDHVKPHNGNLALFRSKANWAPRCWSCHSSKTRADQTGRLGCDASGWPKDPLHEWNR